MAAQAGGGGGASGSYTVAPSSSSSSFSLSWLTSAASRAAWTAVDVVTLFARSLLDPSVRTLQDAGAGSNGTGVRRVATVHNAAQRGTGPQAGAGNRLGGGGGGSSSSSSSSSSGSGGGSRPGKIAGLGPTKCTTSS
jgi:hypothetical protein